MIRRLTLMVFMVACSASESERARQAGARRATGDSVLTTDVVQALRTSTSPGRLIYERPADLSYDSLRVKRPDLARSADRRKR